MTASYQQGGADGLCGIYSILNYLDRFSEWGNDDPTNTLWYLLEACRQFGWLTPQYITAGYEDYHLKAILELQISNYRLPIQAFYLSDVARAKKPKNFFVLATLVTNAGGSLLAADNRRNHWVLVTTEKGTAVIVDSWNKENPVKGLRSNQRALSLDWGLVIMPSKRAKIEINL